MKRGGEKKEGEGGKRKGKGEKKSLQVVELKFLSFYSSFLSI